MPTNLKSLLTRSRSKNELKLRESKDEISPAGNNESNGSGDSGEDDSNASSPGYNAKCECSEHQVNDDCCGCASESSLYNHHHHQGAKPAAATAHGSYSYSLSSPSHNEKDNSKERNISSGNCFPNNDLSYNSDSYSKSDQESPCYSDENFLQSFNSSIATTGGGSATLSTIMPPPIKTFNRQHHHRDGTTYQCCSQQGNYGGASPYEMVSSIGGGVVANGPPGATDYCGGYFVEEKLKNRSIGVGGGHMISMRDNGEAEMRINSPSCRTLFLSSNTLHQANASFESGHLDLQSSPPRSVEFPSIHSAGTLTSTGVAGSRVSSSIHHVIGGPSFRTRSEAITTDGCGSMGACDLPPPLPISSSATSPYCTANSFNVKDGPSCQSLSMRKCETVLALSSLNNNGTISTTASTTTTSGNKSSSSYVRNPVGGITSFPITTNFPSGTAGSTTNIGSVVPSSSTNVGGKVRVMKEKILSTSSSALNCLLHSSSRTGKLLSGWKLSSASATSSSNSGSGAGGSNVNVGHHHMFSSEGSNCLGVNCQTNKHFLGFSSSSGGGSTSDNNKLGSNNHNNASSIHRLNTGVGNPLHHKSRSQLSISENSFSSSPAAPLTPVNRLRRNVSVTNTSSFCPTSGSLSAHSSYSRSSSVSSFLGGWNKENKGSEDPFVDQQQSLFCRLCLSYVSLEETMEILACSCRYCKDCLISYVSFEIMEGADEIACPDASCEKQGVLGMQEVEQLVSPMLTEKHKKFKLFREVEKDNKLMWCPSPGCETVCQIQSGNGILTGGFVPEIDRGHSVVASTTATGVGGSRSGGGGANLPFINCPTCQKTYCAGCKLSWHPDSSCESFRRKLIRQGKLSSEDDELFSLESIKKCPFCHVPIEKDSGCAQMMCKRCKHVFCWYCLASLDDDFLLRHYDKGPCKNKLGHSRASVVWHRAQVIGIFAGFGVLVLLASPLLILAAPCLLCCRCRYCANKLDPEESDLV